MKKEELLKELMDPFWGDETLKEKVYDYISGVSNEMPIIDELGTYGVWSQVNLCCDAEVYEEHQEIINRFINIMSTQKGRQLINSVGRVQGIYSVFKRAGVTAEFIVEESCNRVGEILWYGYLNQCKEMEVWLKDIETYYPEAKQEILNDAELAHKLIGLYTLADSVIKGEPKEELLENI